jgi:hypothetical protein
MEKEYTSKTSATLSPSTRCKHQQLNRVKLQIATPRPRRKLSWFLTATKTKNFILFFYVTLQSLVDIRRRSGGVSKSKTTEAESLDVTSAPLLVHAGPHFKTTEPLQRSNTKSHTTLSAVKCYWNLFLLLSTHFKLLLLKQYLACLLTLEAEGYCARRWRDAIADAFRTRNDLSGQLAWNQFPITTSTFQVLKTLENISDIPSSHLT